MSRHAYLIVAHNEPGLLCSLLRELDDPRNDIYLHVDARSDMDIDSLKAAVSLSRLYLQTPRRKIGWGGYTMVKCELAMLEAASRNVYDSYHLLSGVDFPCKSQDEIHAFIDENPDRNFVGLTGEEHTANCVEERLTKYSLHDSLYRSKGAWLSVLRFAEKAGQAVQRKLHVDRTKNAGVEFQKGDTWFSINHEAVLYLLSQKRQIRKLFRMTVIPDEAFVQTILWNSPLRETLTGCCMRYIDWTEDGAHPKNLDETDYEKIIESGMLFIRKLTPKSGELVRMLREHMHRS